MERTEHLVEMCGESGQLGMTTLLFFVDGRLCENGQTLAEVGLCSRSSISMLKSETYHLLTASKDCTVKVWDASGKCVRTFEAEDQSVMTASFSPDGQLIATSKTGAPTIKIWSADSGE